MCDGVTQGFTGMDSQAMIFCLFLRRVLDCIFDEFWVRAGTPKSTKNRHFAGKDAPGSFFLMLFAASPFFVDLCIDFGTILS